MSQPDFICIGAQKAGTTWLYEMLAQNPSIWLPPLKEVHYFDLRNAGDKAKEKRREHILKLAGRTERRGKGKGSEGEGKAEFLRRLAGDDLLTEEWYRAIFSHPDAKGRVSGEITPAYFALDEEDIVYFRALLPNTKVILIVREPHERNMSQVKMAAARSKRDTFSDDDWNTFLDKMVVRDRGNYARNLPLWQKHVPAEQLLILPFSEVRNNPVGLLRTIEGFIGAQPHEYQAAEEQVHKTKPVTVPQWVSDKVRELSAAQKDYLISTFGAEFYEKTR